MNHRHLLPNEIDLLLDESEELGFGVAPLKAHVRDCAECRDRVDEARFVVEALEELPRFAPSHDFTDRVMAQVQVFEPWHVAARSALARLAPRSRPARIVVLTGGATIATVLTAAMLWIATQTDLLLFTTAVVTDRARELLVAGVRSTVTTIFGEQVFAAVQQAGALGISLAVGSVLLATGGAIFGLRRVAVASARRRG